MEIKRSRMTTRGFLLIWIGISIVLVKDSKEQDSSTAEPLSTAAPTVMKNAEETTSTANPSNASPTMTSTDYSIPTSNGTFAPDHLSNSCHIFTCIGEGCYKNQTVMANSSNTICSSYCEMYRYNSSSFEARCNEHCMHHICNSSQQDNCALHCCNQTQCFNSDDLNGGNMTMGNKTTIAPVTITTTTTTTTTTPAIQYSDKKCRSFICSGADCFKTQTGAATKQCRVGLTHCELQKKVTNGAVSYEAGCSNTCATSTKSCATITNADCFHECCNATTTACCMVLDGQVHFNTATHIHKGSIFRIFTYAFVVVFLSHFFSSSRL